MQIQARFGYITHPPTTGYFTGIKVFMAKNTNSFCLIPFSGAPPPFLQQVIRVFLHKTPNTVSVGDHQRLRW